MKTKYLSRGKNRKNILNILYLIRIFVHVHKSNKLLG